MKTKRYIQDLLNSGQNEKARELCLDLCHSEQNDPQIWVMLGFLHLQLGDAGKAESACRQAVNLNPHEIKAWDILSQALAQQKQFAEATDIARKLVTLKPGTAQLHSQLATLLHTEDHLQEAEDHYLTSIALGDNRVSTHINYGCLLYTSRKYFDAIEQMNIALHIEPENAEACCRLGELYDITGQPTNAISSFNAAIKHMPGKSRPYIALAKTYRALGNRKESEAAFRHALKLEPDNGAAQHSLAICLYDDQDPGPSAAAFEKAIHINPHNELAKCFLSVIQALHGDHRQAVTSLITASRSSAQASAVADSYEYAAKSESQARYFSTTTQMLRFAVDASTVEGIHLEFGVYFGASIRIIATRSNKVIHGFDSFEGIPESWKVGQGFNSAIEPTGSYSTQGVLPDTPDNVQLHSGYFDKSLPEFLAEHSEPAALINIDCDLYSSTKTIFCNTEKQIISGTILIFDEYFCYPTWRDHEYKAFQEFIDRSGLDYTYLAFNFFTGQVVVKIL